jgi:hypothetical protein
MLLQVTSLAPPDFWRMSFVAVFGACPLFLITGALNTYFRFFNDLRILTCHIIIGFSRICWRSLSAVGPEVEGVRAYSILNSASKNVQSHPLAKRNYIFRPESQIQVERQVVCCFCWSDDMQEVIYIYIYLAC